MKTPLSIGFGTGLGVLIYTWQFSPTHIPDWGRALCVGGLTGLAFWLFQRFKAESSPTSQP